jgi:uncharacterized protein YyaL (SSP411 family)
MTNRLINEQSPYLLQHAHNPVDWYPWGDEAFRVAAAQNKPVLVSIGYAACHWCHVMERESFEDEAVAAYMNEHFVCIKVDREEHPDVDHMYMDAVQALSGSGGWPLNVFVTPDRAPFYGGTYYPPRPAYSRVSWSQVLQRMNEIWHKQQDEVAMQAAQMLQHLRQASMRTTQAAGKDPGSEVCDAIAAALLKQADNEWGGFGNAPKFPGTMAISYLLEYHHYTCDEQALKHALRSLDAMIEGGIYDQLGGGFARYATDRYWLIPHFEKMLYDNALLVISLCDAYSITGMAQYGKIIRDTIAFVNRELRHEEGGFYCAIDADSEGVEGKFYTWTWEEWLQYSGDEEGIAAMYFGVKEGGNWEHTNILHVATHIEKIAALTGKDAVAIMTIINDVADRLYKARAHKIRPITDDKCLLAWNALMNTALSKAGNVLGEPAYIQQAETHAAWMLQAYSENDKLLHTWKNGVARIPAKLDDYAYLIQSLIQLSAINGNNKWLVKATQLTAKVIADFGREDGMFYYTPADQKDIPVRKVDLYDGATPSANSVMANNLRIAGMCLENTDWISRAHAMVAAVADTAARYAYSFSNWGIQLQRQVKGARTVVCYGAGAYEAAAELRQKYVPHATVLTCEKEISDLPVLEKKVFDSNLYIFVCSEQECLLPVNSVGEAYNLINH